MSLYTVRPSTIRSTLAIAVCLLVIAPCLAQSPAAPEPPAQSFEAATVRVNPDALSDHGSWSVPNIGSFQATGVSLSVLIRLAYGIDDKQILNKPKWLDSKLYDVSAKPEPGIKLSRAELRPRLQNLLGQRFHLLVHREIRQQSGFGLVVGKGHPHLKPTQGAPFPGFRKSVSPGRLEGLSWTMSDLATNITTLIARPVVDNTGIQGSYDITILYAPDDATESQLPSIFTALEESTGLRLAATKVPVEVLVIDSVDPTPTPN